MNMHIVVCGDIIGGHEFYGPFSSHDDAHRFIEANKLIGWWIVKLKSVV